MRARMSGFASVATTIALTCAIRASGVRAGVFQVADVRLTAMAILTMCTGVATWFADGGRLSPEAIADRYVEMIMKSVKRG